jgi:energy-coupling factor transporter ATP-binding protein EcfA2
VEIILEHVRSFASRNRLPLRPLTLLVGENSSGKSTLLAMISSIFDEVNFPFSPGFNAPPYNLGTFENIATYKAGRYGRDDEFSIGFSTGPREDPKRREAIATYGNVSGNVALRRFRVTTASVDLTVEVSGAQFSGVITPRDGAAAAKDELRFSGKTLPHPGGRARLVPLSSHILTGFYKQMGPNAADQFARVMRVADAGQPPYGSTYSCAPIRSKPRRTYDELSEEYSPEGDHIPTLLSRLLTQERSSADAERVVRALVEFGEESGMFKRVNVKRLGPKAGDPFQVRVAVAGPPANLTDVGYGISQALPIIVQSVLKGATPALLMQQPEVHLHPRAQAALGTFFAKLVKRERNRLVVIETHSDYLVDRVRQEVATGTIGPDRVMILFFHKPGLETRIFPLTLDSFGNVQGAPAEYRRFFLEEEMNVFGRTAK